MNLFYNNSVHTPLRPAKLLPSLRNMTIFFVFFFLNGRWVWLAAAAAGLVLKRWP